MRHWGHILWHVMVHFWMWGGTSFRRYWKLKWFKSWKHWLSGIDIWSHLAWLRLLVKSKLLSFLFPTFPLIQTSSRLGVPIKAELEIWSQCSAKCNFFPHFVHCHLLSASSHPKHLAGGGSSYRGELSIYSKDWFPHYSLDSDIWGSFRWPPKIDNAEELPLGREALAPQTNSLGKGPILEEIFPKA